MDEEDFLPTPKAPRKLEEMSLEELESLIAACDAGADRGSARDDRFQTWRTRRCRRGFQNLIIGAPAAESPTVALTLP